MELPERSRVSPRILFDEAVAGITQRPGRSVLTALGTVIGVAVLLVVLGLTSSASVQVSSQFSLVEATQVSVTQQVPVGTSVRTLQFPLDAEARAERIAGVNSAALTWNLLDLSATNPPGTRSIQPIAASPGVFDTAGAHFSQGRAFDGGHDGRAARVAVIGSGAARDLGITDLSRRPALLIAGLRFTVIGIIDDTLRMPGLLAGIIIPTGTAHLLWNDPTPESEAQVILDVDPGAAPVVGQQLPLAMSATTPDRFSVALPPDPQGLRASVDAQLSGLFLGLGAVCLVVGMIGIANTTIVAVIERTGEIGLRRAMGARPRHIAAQFLAEAAILGVLGGLIGTSLGVVTVVVVCASLTWTAVIPPLLIVLGPLIGLAAGTLAGIYPALRASRLEPVDALRS
ncbi:ABC transporter permease [Tessaracoccus lacteus]|uniref:ABC transporter permease n=1 Tax=Tessaracoccus lacteus TaxID=3041766 RepID=A0ABY8PXA4_9ACTN|nr:ABC transporter permease [Tessaracoccus sp. T21]WGT47125.1 ABC transporter permease [Tessaracoccus sp. T21]